MLEQSIQSDADLVKATLAGHTEAYGVLVDRHWSLALALALSKLADGHEAEDVVQAGFVKAYTQLGRLRKPEVFAGWLCRIVSQDVVNRIRHQRRQERLRVVQQENLGVLQTNPGLTDVQIDFVHRAIAKLPEKARVIVIMRFISGLSATEIAQKLGKSPGSIRARLHRAYQRLRVDLMPLFEEASL